MGLTPAATTLTRTSALSGGHRHLGDGPSRPAARHRHDDRSHRAHLSGLPAARESQWSPRMSRGCFVGVTAGKILDGTHGSILWTMPQRASAPTTASEPRSTARLELAAASIGCVLVIAALAIIWMARLPSPATST